MFCYAPFVRFLRSVSAGGAQGWFESGREIVTYAEMLNEIAPKRRTILRHNAE